MTSNASATLAAESGYLTFINTFTVEPEKADDLLVALKRATVDLFCRQPGFISVSLHLSRDRSRVVNYAQWRSKGDYEAMSKLPEVQAHMKTAAALASAFDPVDYDLREVVVASAG